MDCTYSILTAAGGREVNEDSAAACVLRNRTIASLADGLGGQGCGEIASALAVETVMRELSAPALLYRGNVSRALSRANAAVFARQQELGNRMMTTLAAVAIQGRRLTIAHAGDSRVYWFRNGKILYQTPDHSVTQLMAASGEIEPDMIRGHQSRNLLMRALGQSADLQPDLSGGWLRPGDRLLLCSDGFWELVVEEEMIRAACGSTPEDWLERMEQIVLDAQTESSDNYTAVAIVAH